MTNENGGGKKIHKNARGNGMTRAEGEMICVGVIAKGRDIW